jgi:hypothetical protein
MAGHGAWAQEWEESESGWGTRSEGYYLYLTKEAAQADTKQRVEKMRAEEAKQGYGRHKVPSCYVRPCGDPQFVPVSAESLATIVKQGILSCDRLKQVQ